MKELFEQLIEHHDLTSVQMQHFIENCMHGKLSDVHIAVFLALMRMKGETPLELTTASKTILTVARLIDLGENLIDIVGTGGDSKNTFNVSTVSSFVVAAAGLKVAKHGNRSVSSTCGSADFLKEAGFNLDLTDDALKSCIKDCGIAFLFAPNFHSALKYAKAARNALGIRTLFNLLGPLLNPARAKYQVVGVFAKKWQYPLTYVLKNLGSIHTLILHSDDGLDEISICAPTSVVECYQGKIQEWEINPKMFGCYHQSLEPIVVRTPNESLSLAVEVLKGETGPARSIILLNSAAAIYLSEHCSTFAEGIEIAKSVIDNGKALAVFEKLKALTNSFKYD